MIHIAMFQKHKYIYILFHPPVRRPTISTPSLSSHYARFTPAQLESALYTRKCSFIAVLVASAREYKKKKNLADGQGRGRFLSVLKHRFGGEQSRREIIGEKNQRRGEEKHEEKEILMEKEEEECFETVVKIR